MCVLMASLGGIGIGSDGTEHFTGAGSGVEDYDGKSMVLDSRHPLVSKTNMKKQKEAYFVMLYSPSCGYCNRAKPAFHELKVEGVRKLLVNGSQTPENQNSEFITEMKMNYGLSIEGYPTYYLFIPSEEVIKIERYNGSRTVEDMQRFLKTYV